MKSRVPKKKRRLVSPHPCLASTESSGAESASESGTEDPLATADGIPDDSNVYCQGAIDNMLVRMRMLELVSAKLVVVGDADEPIETVL